MTARQLNRHLLVGWLQFAAIVMLMSVGLLGADGCNLIICVEGVSEYELVGTVVDGDGQPLGGAELLGADLRFSDGSFAAYAEGTVAEDGTLEGRAVLPGMWGATYLGPLRIYGGPVPPPVLESLTLEFEVDGYPVAEQITLSREQQLEVIDQWIRVVELGQVELSPGESQ